MTRAGGARLLVVSPDAPGPLDQGFRIRVHHLTAALAAGGHRVTLLAAASGPADDRLDELGVEVVRFRRDALPRTGLARRARDLAAGRPHGTLAAAVADLRPALDRLLTERAFDVVQVELPDLVQVAASRGLPTVLDAHNIWSELTRRRQALVPSVPRRLAGTVVARRQQTAERRAWRAADLCLATSEREQAVLAGGGARRTALVPNGVDVDAVRPGAGSGPPRREPPCLVFVGLLSYGPNADAATQLVREVLPRVHRTRPDARVRIVGDGVSPVLAALAGPSVEFTGPVPDVRPHLAGAGVVVTPLRVGSGTRLKILEALAMARPVVTTSVGAEGLDLVDGVHALIADGPDALAAAVSRVLGEPALAERLGTAGRALVESCYGWSHIGGQLRAAYDELLAIR